jgi:hypothetical protein
MNVFQKCNVSCADANPIPTDEVVQHFNELRQDIVLLYELKLGLTTCEYELQTLRHQWEQFFPGKVRAIIFMFTCILCVGSARSQTYSYRIMFNFFVV